MPLFIKRIFLICLFGCLLLLALYPTDVFLACIKWQAKRYFRSSFQADVSFEKVELKLGKIHFSQGKVCKEGDMLATFNAVLSPRMNLKKREIGGKLSIENLKIIRRKLEKSSFPVLGSSLNRFFSLDLKTTIRSGELFLYDYSGPSSFFHHVCFDLTHYFSSGNSFGEIVFFKDFQAAKFSSFFFKSHDKNLDVAGEFSLDFFPKMYGLATYFLDLGDALGGWEFKSGTIDGKLKLRMENGNPVRLEADVLLADIKGENPSLEIIAQIEQIQGLIELDFKNFSGINADFLIQGGKLALQDKPEVFVDFWDLNELNSKIAIKNGKLQSSILHADFLGLKGKIALDADSDDLMHMDFCGRSKEMFAFFPISFQKGFQKAFPDDYMQLSAKIKKRKAGLELEGYLNITDENEIKTHFDFGCHFGQVEKKAKEMGMHALPFSLSRSVSHFFDQIKDQFCLTSKRLGWMRAKNVDLQKFLSPFLFKDYDMHVSALVDMDATFDERFLVIFYEGERFLLHSPYFELKADTIDKKEEQVAAVHCINLETFSHVGYLPLKEATYLQKTNGLRFEKADVCLQFEDETIKIKQLKTNWRDLAFEGNIEIRVNSLEDIDVEISTDSFLGPAKTAFSFASRFLSLKIWDIPYEKGELEGFFDFKFHFSPKTELREGIIRGKLRELAYQAELFICSGVDAEFEYDYSEKSLFFTDCKGMLSLPSKNACYNFHLPKLCFKNFPFFQLDAALELSENGKKFFAANARTSERGDGREILIEGEQCFLQAFQNGEQVAIPHFSFKNVEGSVLMEIAPKRIAIKELIAKKGDGKEIAFAGCLDFDKQALFGNFDKVDFDLKEIWKKTTSIKPAGKVSANGSLYWQFGRDLEIQANLTYKDLEIGKLPFGRDGRLHCLYSSQSGLEIEGLELAIPHKEEWHKLNLGKIFYNFEEKKLTFEGVDFSFSKDKLEAALRTFESIYPDKVTPFLSDLIKNAKEKGSLEGRVSLALYPDNFWFYLYLKDGMYSFAGKEIELRNFALILDPHEIKAWSHCHYQNLSFGLHFLADSFDLSQGFVQISNPKKNESAQEEILIKWHRKETGVQFDQIEGKFAGLKVALKKEGNETDKQEIKLKGKIEFDLEQVPAFLFGYFSQSIKNYSISGLYQFEGIVGYNKLKNESFLSGILSGREITVSGLKLAEMTSDLAYRKDSFSMKNFSIKDVALQLSVQQIDFKREQCSWGLWLHDAKIQNVRFSKMRWPWLKADQKRKSFFRFLHIPAFSLEHLTATIGNSESIKGCGRLEFTNLPKKTLFSSLLFLPTEITARIGLDLSNLVPVRGTIVYEIKDRKINFLDLKDMFSEGKRSRFYLAEQTPAWVDFAGNLNLKIKMKQYNLLMKLAEFFTISVKGTLLKPAYTLSNHLDDEESL